MAMQQIGYPTPPPQARMRTTNVLVHMFMLSLLIMFNPFLELPAPVKFGLIGMLSMMFAFLSGPANFLGRRFLGLPEGIFLTCLVIMMVRMNDLPMRIDTTVFEARLQVIVSIMVFFGALFAYRQAGRTLYLKAMTTFLAIICGYLLLNPGYLLTPYSHSGLGDFTPDSYQQVGIVFGLLLLIALDWMTGRRAPLWQKALMAAAVLIFLYVLINNRARGEMLGVMVAIMAAYFPRLSLPLFVLVITDVSIIKPVLSLFEAAGVQRLLLALELSDFGTRDMLFADALRLLWHDPWLAIFGGGGNYFQLAMGYDESNYPHNMFLEGWLSGGIVMLGVMVWIFVWPVVRGYIRALTGQPVNRLNFGLCIFFVLIFSKSGTINTSWVLALLLPFFIDLRKEGTLRASAAPTGAP